MLTLGEDWFKHTYFEWCPSASLELGSGSPSSAMARLKYTNTYTDTITASTGAFLDQLTFLEACGFLKAVTLKQWQSKIKFSIGREKLKLCDSA